MSGESAERGGRLPSAVSIMLDRLWPRLIPRTVALEGRSTRGPRVGGATLVTSGAWLLFSEGAEGKVIKVGSVQTHWSFTNTEEKRFSSQSEEMKTDE